ncbi:MAG: twin-arginine translocase subunit TatC [Actinobacteria bacterium]|nr:twin-arginine translocase subunit TatC [Actinomycetota bacterium]
MAPPHEARMPLLEHLRELRKRVLRSAIAVVIAFGVGWYFYNPIITTLAKPVCDLKAAQQSGSVSCGALYISGVLGPLDLQIKVSLLTGVILSAPFWLYQLWAFIAPALHRKEKRTSVLFVAAATPFFAMGAALGYFILPVAIKALFGFTPDSISNLVRFDDYLDFVLRLILLVGLAFELPIFLLTFNLIGFLRGKTILKPWRGWVFGIFLVVAAFSPTADPLSMIALSAPLILLYFLAGAIAIQVDKRRDKRNSMDEVGSMAIESPTTIRE